VNRAPIPGGSQFSTPKIIHPIFHIKRRVQLPRLFPKSVASFSTNIFAMFRRNGSPEDQRIKAEMEARNARVAAPHFRGPGPQDVEDRVCK
jgi:hypothetical protein